MQFDDTQPIYLQIFDYGIDQVLRGGWIPEERIPSVRDMAAEVGVNPNTVQRAYSSLEEHKIIFNRRGRGFFVEADGMASAKKYKRSWFEDQLLPIVLDNMRLLDIELDELMTILQNNA